MSGFARTISGVMFSSHLIIAIGICGYFERVQSKSARLYPALALVLVFLSLGLNRAKIYELFLERDKPASHYYSKYYFLRNIVANNEIILTDNMTGSLLPSFGGKVLACPLPLFGIPDGDQRRNDVNSFFNTLNKDTARVLLWKYKPGYVLIDTAAKSPSAIVRGLLDSIGSKIHKGNGITIIKPDYSCIQLASKN
jgi:hypothetical protein